MPHGGVEEMKVLLLGASGFLGGRILQTLRNQPEVEVIGTYCQNGTDDLVQLDIHDHKEFARLYQACKPDIIIWSLMSGEQESKLIEHGLAQLLPLIESHVKIVYLSTDGVFSKGSGSYTEEDIPSYMEADTPLAQYSNAKLKGEELLQEHHDNHVIIRTGPIYGTDVAGQWDKRINQLQQELTEGRKLYRASNLYRSFTHVEDLARAVVEVSLREISGLLHIGPVEKDSYYSFNRKMAAMLNLPVENIIESLVTSEDAQKKGLPLDTSMCSMKARAVLSHVCREV